ncbi:MFS transporter [Agrococcus sp. Marseille-Q4369]|uniref:MFS transporter n=1 Tax=Agrococcus sp. Marseille-Q4369 TaxID=2810513 RepID=UPI001B8BABBE|nr:MFS transporter [Agrococcus sp. Marseille-Q4369]
MTKLDQAAPGAAARPRPQGHAKQLFALSAGHALEWYDWAMFGLLSVYIGQAFFPGGDPVASTLNSLAVFAVGFVVRPIGGVLLGFVADRVGRKPVMIGAVGVMAGASLVIGVLPTHETLGVWAGVIVLLMRILQGFSAGIEGSLGAAYGVELVPDRPGYVAGFMAIFNNFGNMLAPLTAFLATAAIGADGMGEYGWRIPFIAGGLLGVIVLWLRRALPESLPRKQGEAAAAGNDSREVWRGVRKYWLSILAVVFIVGAIQAYNYTWLSGLPSLATGTYNEDPTGVFAVATAVGVVLTVSAWILSRVLDKWDLSRWFVIGRLLTIPSIFLVLLYSGNGVPALATVMLGGSLILVLNMTIFSTVANLMVPKFCRGTAVGLGYGIGVAVFGGTASYLFVFLQSNNLPWAFPIYVATLCALSVIFYLLAKRQNGVFRADM